MHLPLAPIFLALLLLGWPTRGSAAGVVGDGTAGSCTEAALEAALNGGGAVTFSCGAAATIPITRPKLIATATTIDGDGRITLDGGGTTRIFTVEAAARLGLTRLTLSDAGGEAGGAVYNQGRLSLEQCAWRGNNTAIINDGETTVTASTFSENTGGDMSGAIANFDGTLVVTTSEFTDGGGRSAAISSFGSRASVVVEASTFRANSAGALYSQAGTLVVRRSTFSGNGDFGIRNFDGTLTVEACSFEANVASAIVNGGVHGGSATVRDSTFMANRSAENGGALSNGGTLIVDACTLRDNAAASFGGAVYNSPRGVLRMTRSTLAGNTARNGGGLFNQGSAPLRGGARVANCTFHENSATIGGAIANLGEALIENCTLAFNTATAGNAWGGGLYQAGSFGVTLANSLFFFNNRGRSDCSIQTGGTFFDGGHNLLGDESCLLVAGVNGNLVGIDPLLDPAGLADNGGPTQTIALQAQSPAIDAGNAEVCAGDSVQGLDQRGYLRPGVGHSGCSIGAYEADGEPAPRCDGDCDGAGAVTVDEIVTLVNIALGNQALEACTGGVPPGTTVDVTLIIRAVVHALGGC